MKLFKHDKDGGPESTVDGYWLIEWKRFFSIALLRFGNGSRSSYHSHAFDAIYWVLSGRLIESELHSDENDRVYTPGIKPVVTRRSMFHRVFSIGTSWVLTFRGPWSKTWREYDPKNDSYSTLAHGRKIVP